MRCFKIFLRHNNFKILNDVLLGSKSSNILVSTRIQTFLNKSMLLCIHESTQKCLTLAFISLLDPNLTRNCCN